MPFDDLLVDPCFSYALSDFNSSEFVMSAAVFQPEILPLIPFVIANSYALSSVILNLCLRTPRSVSSTVCSAAFCSPLFGSFGSFSSCVWSLLDLDTST